MGLRIATVGIAAAAAMALGLASTTPAATKPQQQFYVALGDSYTAGYLATGSGQGSMTRSGFAYQFVPLAAKRGYNFKLVNFGCAGATTRSILHESLSPGAACLGPGAPTFRGTQIANAEKFLRQNRKKSGLITVTIGGNDITSCTGATNPVACVVGAQTLIERNVTVLVKRLRAAAGSRVRIIGLTYPDVVLGQWIGETPNQDLARQSQAAFELLINPALERSYAKAKASFIDVTEKTGGYGTLDGATKEVAPFGVLPLPVAKVCELTNYCLYGDIHPNVSGYAFIAGVLAKALPRVSPTTTR